jgi:hypothetical protein
MVGVTLAQQWTIEVDGVRIIHHAERTVAEEPERRGRGGSYQPDELIKEMLRRTTKSYASRKSTLMVSLKC